jgi:hypothetical protein
MPWSIGQSYKYTELELNSKPDAGILDSAIYVMDATAGVIFNNSKVSTAVLLLFIESTSTFSLSFVGRAVPAEERHGIRPSERRHQPVPQAADCVRSHDSSPDEQD